MVTREPTATAVVLLGVSALVLVSALASRIASHVGVPVVLLFMAMGLLAGTDGIGGLAFDDHELAFRIGTVALVLILFDGGLNTNASLLRKYAAPAGLLATFGVVATAGLFLAGAIFLASRFVRGTWLLVASGVLTVIALLGGRLVLASDATIEPAHEMFVVHPDLPRPEAPGGSRPTFSGDPKTDITPVSLSFPTSERYVQASRQLVSSERPFVPRIVYVTSTFIAGLHALWLAFVALLVWAHRERLLALKAKVVERLRRRPTAPDPTTAAEAPPF